MPNSEREISRPSTVAAERLKDLNALDFSTAPIASPAPPRSLRFAVVRALGARAPGVRSRAAGPAGLPARSGGRRRGQPGGQLLVGRLPVHRGAVLGLQRRVGNRLPLRRRVELGHQRPGGAQPGPGHRGRAAPLGEHRHHRLADAQLGEQFGQVVVLGLGIGANRLGQVAGIVRGEGAQRVLHPIAELAEHAVRHVGRHLGDEEDPDALGPDQPDGLGDLLQEGLGGVAEQQVRLVEEEHQAGLVRIPDLRQLVEQVGQQPHQEGGEQRGPVGDGRQLQGRDHPATVGVLPDQVGRLPLGLAEEHLAAGILQRDQGPQDHPGGRLAQPADAGQLGLALVRGEEADQGTQILQVQQRQPGLVGVVEDQVERGLLGVVQVQHLGQQQRAERGHGGPHRDAAAEAAERQELHRIAGRLPVVTGLGGAFAGPVAGGARGGQAGQVALHVGHHHRHALGRELFGQQLQRLGLAGAGGAGDQAVPVEHAQWDAHPGVRMHGAVDHHRADLQGGPVDRVTGRDLGGGVAAGCAGVLGHCRLPPCGCCSSSIAAYRMTIRRVWRLDRSLSGRPAAATSATGLAGRLAPGRGVSAGRSELPASLASSKRPLGHGRVGAGGDHQDVDAVVAPGIDEPDEKRVAGGEAAEADRTALDDEPARSGIPGVDACR